MEEIRSIKCKIKGSVENIITKLDTAINNKNSSVKFLGTDFKIDSFCGGTIYSNCKELNYKDLSIITNFDKDSLNNLEQDLIYLQKIVAMRKNELLDSENEYKLDIYDYRENKKKMVNIKVKKYTLVKDIYNDYEIRQIDDVEEWTYANIKDNQKEIENKISSLKTKYNIQ
jgi:hypothetical protein